MKDREKTAVDVRTPRERELPSIEAIHRQAFRGELEARLVRLLIAREKASVSLAAAIEGRLVGHILFSPATCESGAEVTLGQGLAPLAVLPEFHRRGIGAELVRAGLAACRSRQTPWVVVLGEPDYYGRFGFGPASRYRLSGEFGGDDAFQILAFADQGPPPTGGHIHYAPEFGELFRGSS